MGIPIAEGTVTTLWGEADDGAMVEVSVPSGTESLLDERWPPLGLARHDKFELPVERAVALRPGAAGTLLVEVDDEPSFGGWDRVESELALFAAERLAGQVAVHAAAIAMHGRVLLVPGPTGVGKSQLCAAAAEAGATILSDEYALVDAATGSVAGWQRAVRLRRPDGGVDRLDIARPASPMPVGLVALVKYQPGEVLTIGELVPGKATLGLLANTLCARSRPQESLDAALRITRTCRSVAGTRGEAAEAVRVLLAQLASSDAAGS